jgi:DNA-binding transcriptional LysR family regulator
MDQEDLWRRLDWDDVRVFFAVAESGSLSAAAKSLGMTQPTISRRIEDFEIRMGARLFDRSAKGVTLTALGAGMVEYASGMARMGDSIVRKISGRDHADAGRVRLAAPDGLASFILMPTLGAFLQTNPQIELTLDCGLWAESSMGGEVDLSLDMASEPAPDWVSIPIGRVHYAHYASRQYLNTYGHPKTMAEVAQHRMVRHAAFKEQRSTWNRKAEAVRDLAANHLLTNSSAAMLLAVANGAGIGSLPTVVDTLGLDLVHLDLEPVAHPVLWLRHRLEATRQGRVQRVKEWVMRMFDPADKPWFRDHYVHPRDFERERIRAGIDPAEARRA